MTDGDVADPVLSFSQRLNDGIDAVANNAEDMRRAPIDQCFDQDVGGVQIAVQIASRRGRRLSHDIGRGF